VPCLGDSPSTGRSPPANEPEQGSRNGASPPICERSESGGRVGGAGAAWPRVQGATLLGEPRHKPAHLRAAGELGGCCRGGEARGRQVKRGHPGCRGGFSRRGRCRGPRFLGAQRAKNGGQRVRNGPPPEHLCGGGALKAGWPRFARRPPQGAGRSAATQPRCKPVKPAESPSTARRAQPDPVRGAA
jgi:hypothetical protein